MLFLALAAERVSDARGADEASEILIARIAEGDKEALAELYSQTKTSVYGFALSILRDRHEAEDVMQDAYVRIYASAGEYKPQGKPMAWVLTITRNLSLTKLRAGKKSPIPAGETWDPPDARDAEEDSLSRLLLQTAMERLTGQERQIVMLHAVSGQKHREIAALLGIPLSTALSKYHRALSKLKNLDGGWSG